MHGRPTLPSLLAVCHLPRNDYRLRVPDVQAATRLARRDPRFMARTAAQAGPQLISLALPGTPESVPVARWHVRAALGLHGLGEYADDAEIITSELVTNAIQHVSGEPGDTIGVLLVRVCHPVAVAVIVSDSSRKVPIRRPTLAATSERGRGLQLVEALSSHWGWHPNPSGKAVFAVIAKEE